MNYIRIILISAGILITSAISAQTKDSLVTFKVSGLCGLCKERIEKAAKVKGVSSPIWTTSTQLLQLSYQPAVISLETIHKKIAAVGHDTELRKATEDAYHALPECCLYRDTAHVHSKLEEDSLAVSGIIVREDSKGNFSPLMGANISWLDDQKVKTSDDHGVFSIPLSAISSNLVVSYAGFTSDTIEITEARTLQVVLGSNNMLKTVEVTSRKRDMFTSMTSSFRVTNINAGELLKAACCNLSESFETNPTVDVQYNDAATGSKQIQLLGLAGIYTQLTVENLPGPRGLSTLLGLNSIAGPWVESIQLSKGTGSVVNGFESIAGQINIEMKKPGDKNEILLNGYINSFAKSDYNVNILRALNKKWATALLLHDDFLNYRSDMNNDGFRDLPTGNLFSAVNKWHYNNNGFSSEFGWKYLRDDRTGGDMNFVPSMKLSGQVYGIGLKTTRYEGFVKAGYIFPEKKYKSIGLQLSTFHHKLDSYFGQYQYNATQQNFYSNLIYQSIIGNTAHKFRTGLSFSSDHYNELFRNIVYERTEAVPGTFLEYTYGLNKVTVVSGIRADHNSIYGWFVTPRLNIRYSPFAKTTIRLGAGRGQRTANIFAENLGSFVSSRQVVISPSIYGLMPEVAWNKGISIDQKMKLFKRDALLSADFYRNDFTNQVIADVEQPGSIKFYNLNGSSFSNSLQIELDVIPVKRLDMRFAYRWYDVRANYSGVLKQKPLNARNRAFVNAGYETGRWKFNTTYSYNGSKRIPVTIQGAMIDRSPAYSLLNAQATYTFGKRKNFDIYVGGENLSDVFQQNAIIAAQDPFGPHFDASMVWGPISGRMVYAGIRFTLR